MVKAYGTSFWSLIPFTMQMALIVIGGYVLATTPAVAKIIDKLASVHLNDQNGLKFDQDKSFGGANLRSAYNQVRVLEEAGYGRRGEFIGLDVKAMRTQSQEKATAHLINSRAIFMHLVDKVRFDCGHEQAGDDRILNNASCLPLCSGVVEEQTGRIIGQAEI